MEVLRRVTVSIRRRRWPTAWCTSAPRTINLYALDASTGALLWKYATGDGTYSSPAVANGVVYVGSDDGNVYALNAGTGALLWKYDDRKHYRLLAGGGQWRSLCRLRRPQPVRLERQHGRTPVEVHNRRQRFTSSPAVANGVVYVGSGDGNVYALDASTGALLWTYTTGAWI